MGIFWRLAFWLLRWSVPPVFLSLLLLCQPKACAWVVTRLASLLTQEGKDGDTPNRAKGKGLRHVSFEAIDVLKLRVEGMKVLTGKGTEETGLVVGLLEVRTPLRASLYSFFRTRPLHLHISHVRVSSTKTRPPIQEAQEGGTGEQPLEFSLSSRVRSSKVGNVTLCLFSL